MSMDAIMTFTRMGRVHILITSCTPLKPPTLILLDLVFLISWSSFVCQVQPDLEELEVNMEDNEDAESTKSEVKLGKLQFSLDYDFQKGEVSLITECT